MATPGIRVNPETFNPWSSRAVKQYFLQAPVVRARAAYRLCERVPRHAFAQSQGARFVGSSLRGADVRAIT